MKVLSVISQKGGAGKTTTAINLAVEAQTRGIETVVIDLDPQASATSWSDLRDGTAPVVVSAPIARLARTIDTARTTGAALVIIDTPAGIGAATAPSVEAADLVLIPVRVSIIDSMTAGATLGVVRAASGATPKPCRVVLTCCPTRGSHGDGVEKALVAIGAEVVPVRIGDRILFRSSFEGGKGVVEMKPNDPASHEISALWAYLKGELAL